MKDIINVFSDKDLWPQIEHFKIHQKDRGNKNRVSIFTQVIQVGKYIYFLISTKMNKIKHVLETISGHYLVIWKLYIVFLRLHSTLHVFNRKLSYIKSFILLNLNYPPNDKTSNLPSCS